MSTLISWPATPPEGLAGVYSAVAQRLGIENRTVSSLAELADVRSGGRDKLVAVLGTASSTEEAAESLAALQAIDAAADLDWVVVVGDGYIGTDAGDLGSMVSGAAVTAVRSAAIRQGGSARPNAVCVPDALFGRTGSQRGPLPLTVTVDDIADSAAFLLGDSGGYLNGQVLFVNGGRHLFSSMTA